MGRWKEGFRGLTFDSTLTAEAGLMAPAVAGQLEREVRRQGNPMRSLCSATTLAAERAAGT